MKIRILNLILGFLLIGVTSNAQNSSNSDTLITTGPGRYEILRNGKETIKIPFKMHKGKPLMELEINGKKATLMIDNGILWDQVWLFGSPLVKELNLTPVKTDSDPQESSNFYPSDNLKLTFRDIIFHEQPTLISPVSAGYGRLFPGVDGQLSSTFFKHFIVEFDFIQNEIILHNPKTFVYKGKGCTLDMESTETGTYSVPFQITMKDGKAYKDRADIDLGGIYMFKVALIQST